MAMLPLSACTSLSTHTRARIRGVAAHTSPVLRSPRPVLARRANSVPRLVQEVLAAHLRARV